jgi:hypothetical protein
LFSPALLNRSPRLRPQTVLPSPELTPLNHYDAPKKVGELKLPEAVSTERLEIDEKMDDLGI